MHKLQLLGLLAGSALAAGCTDGSLEDVLLGHYFVKLDAETADVASSVSELAVLFGFEPIHTFDKTTQGFSARLPHPLVPELEELTQVEWVRADDEDADWTPPEDPPDQNVDLGADETPDGVARIGGPYTGSVNYFGIHVAVIDTGGDMDHPDINWAAEEDVVARRTGSSSGGTDDNGHGTHVAGTIGAKANQDGVAGVAPGIPIHAIRVLDDDGSGAFSDIIAGLEYVAAHPEIRVVNMSLGGAYTPFDNDPLEAAIRNLEEAGVIVCIAAGNEGRNTDGFTPAAYDLGVVVSAYDASGGDSGFASFSNFGDQVDIAAPGVDIVSTYPDDSYASLNGTSMATPHVAGAMAVYVAHYPNTTPAQARAALVGSAEEGIPGQGGDHPEPLLDLQALLAQ